MFMVVTDRLALRPVRVGVEIAASLSRLYGSRYDIAAAARLFGSEAQPRRAEGGRGPRHDWRPDGPRAEARWRLLRARYLLYR